MPPELPEEITRTMSGVSKRLFVALCDFRGTPPQLEDALFQMASVIDSTSKYHFPQEQSSRRRFTCYLDSVATQIFNIATSGKLILLDCTFRGNDGNDHSLGDVLYGIRCSSYHDPNEVDDLIHWGEPNQIGTKDGKFVVNGPLLMAILLVLLSDDANADHIDRTLFTDEHFLIVKEVQHPFHRFIGNRSEIFRVLELEENP